MSGLAPFLHPALMTATLILALLVLVIGLRIRNQRRTGPGPWTARLAARHMSLGRWFTAILAGGYVLGLAGMLFWLEEPVFGTGHSFFGSIALVIFLGTSYLGRKLRLRPSNEDIRQLHSFCAFLAVFVSLVVAFLGFQLLP